MGGKLSGKVFEIDAHQFWDVQATWMIFRHSCSPMWRKYGKTYFEWGLFLLRRKAPSCLLCTNSVKLHYERCTCWQSPFYPFPRSLLNMGYSKMMMSGSLKWLHSIMSNIRRPHSIDDIKYIEIVNISSFFMHLYIGQESISVALVLLTSEYALHSTKARFWYHLLWILLFHVGPQWNR